MYVCFMSLFDYFHSNYTKECYQTLEYPYQLGVLVVHTCLYSRVLTSQYQEMHTSQSMDIRVVCIDYAYYLVLCIPHTCLVVLDQYYTRDPLATSSTKVPGTGTESKVSLQVLVLVHTCSFQFLVDIYMNAFTYIHHTYMNVVQLSHSHDLYLYLVFKIHQKRNRKNPVQIQFYPIRAHIHVMYVCMYVCIIWY